MSFFWMQFALHCNLRGWDSVSEFLTYTLGIIPPPAALYDAYNDLVFYDASPVFVIEGAMIRCDLSPEATRNIAIICTYIRAFSVACSETTISLYIPILDMPDDSFYTRIIKFVERPQASDEPLLLDFLLLELMYEYLSNMTHQGFRNLLQFPCKLTKNDVLIETDEHSARKFCELAVMRILYPDREPSLSNSNVGDFIRYRQFCHSVWSSYERQFSDRWVWWSPTETWVPQMYLWEYRYYMVRLATLIRAMKRFVRQHALAVENLLWKPPAGLMVRKGWINCVSIMATD